MLNPDWSPETFAGRRDRALERLRRLDERSALVLAAAPEVVVGRDLELRYRVDPDLWYLTSYEEPDAVAVLRPGHDEPFVLFVRPRDPDREVWTGPRGGVDAATDRYGADAAHHIAELAEKLPGLLRDIDRIWYRPGAGRPAVDRVVLDALRAGRGHRQKKGFGPSVLADPGPVLDEMRLVKEPAEIDAIRSAVGITVDAFRSGLTTVAAGVGEWEVEAAVDHAFRSAGADGPAFATIAASGANATVLHYIDNDRRMEDGDLLLLDAGARHRIYNADLTRTVPVGGAFTGPQRDVYAAVLDAHRAAIDAARPGSTTDDVHRAAVDTLVRAMVDLGLLDGDPEELAADEQAVKRFFPHKTSHWLGLDVHDVGTYAVDGEPRTLEPGMVLTIEPGLYVPTAIARPDDDRSDPPPEPPDHLRGIGVRIEDDVLVGEAGPEILSGELPVEIDEVEAMAG